MLYVRESLHDHASFGAPSFKQKSTCTCVKQLPNTFTVLAKINGHYDVWLIDNLFD